MTVVVVLMVVVTVVVIDDDYPSFSRIEFGLDDGYLLHVSGKCVKPVSNRISDGVELGLYDDCDGHKFGFTKGGSIKHLGSGKCIQPRDEVCGVFLLLV